MSGGPGENSGSSNGSGSSSGAGESSGAAGGGSGESAGSGSSGAAPGSGSSGGSTGGDNSGGVDAGDGGVVVSTAQPDCGTSTMYPQTSFVNLAVTPGAKLDPDENDALPDAGVSSPAGWHFYGKDGAVCRDGSPAGFYVHYANPASTKLFIYLEGGGACSSATFCSHNPANMATMFAGGAATQGQTIVGSLTFANAPQEPYVRPPPKAPRRRTAPACSTSRTLPTPSRTGTASTCRTARGRALRHDRQRHHSRRRAAGRAAEPALRRPPEPAEVHRAHRADLPERDPGRLCRRERGCLRRRPQLRHGAGLVRTLPCSSSP